MSEYQELYEVKCVIKDDEYQDTFRNYMIKKHIPDILKTDCFTNIYFVKEEDDENTYKISYLAKNKQTLDKYTAEFAPALREDFLKNMDISMVSISRRFTTCAFFSHNSV